MFVTEVDIAHLLQAKAAIAAGILTLLHRVGLEPPQIKMLYLAGGFGLHLDVTNAIACGMLPGFVPEQVQVIGNSSLAGAYLALGGRLPFGNLPGDITVSRGGVSVSLLLGTGILLSIVLTVILNIVVRR